MTGVNPAAGESVLPEPEPADLDTELVPDLTTELDEAAAAQDAATGAPPPLAPARRFAVYDTRMERYVSGVTTREAAESAGTSKGGRYRLHELDTTGHLAPASRP